jgi:hypothetical protein
MGNVADGARPFIYKCAHFGDVFEVDGTQWIVLENRHIPGAHVGRVGVSRMSDALH